MSLPVSIGDALLLSQIAYKLGKAFTSGRKAAPAEFVDIRNLLYVLGDVLEIVSQGKPDVAVGLRPPNHEPRGPDHARDHDEVIMKCVSNCRPTLEQLRILVEKYTVIDPDTNSPESKSWKDDVKRNWKKVSWTREETSLDRLRIILTNHINSLNLALTARNRDQGNLTFERIDAVSKKLDEIYQWFAANLKYQASSTGVAGRADHHAASGDWQPLTFSLSMDLVERLDPIFLCPRASFHEDWVGSNADPRGRKQLFECHCASLNDGIRAPSTEPFIHQHKLSYHRLPVSLLIRIAGERSERGWQIYAGSGSSTQPVSLMLGSVTPSATNEFQRRIDKLSVLQAREYGKTDLSTTMISRSMGIGGRMVSILDFKPDTSSLFGKLASARFEANGRHFTAIQHESCHMLHYRCIRDADIDSDTTEADSSSNFHDLSHTDLVIIGKDQLQTIHLTRDTSVSLGGDLQEVTLSNVSCATASRDNNVDDAGSKATITCAQVHLRFQDFVSADKAFSLIQSMKRELWIIYLRCCRWGEQVMFHRKLGDSMIREFFLQDALLEVILDPTSGHYRLIVTSSCGSLSVCTELPEDFLSKMAAGETVAGHDMTTWFVEITGNGTRVTSRPTGGDFNSVRLLEQSLSTLAIERG